ncbi:hypothetical protein G9A89_018622 [Geosiphon pyriformis]|nr:hypothetical protein G9A89_018622 [Geosiphon pyriformis]
MSQISTIFKRALLHFSLPSFTSFNKHSQELVLLSARQVSETLDIHVSSPDVENYKNVPLTAWTQVHNLLSSIYVATAKVAYEKGQPLLEFNVLFEEWCGYSVELCDIDNQDQYEVIFGDEKDLILIRSNTSSKIQ